MSAAREERPTATRRRIAWGFVGGALAAAMLLAWRDPARGGYPSCVFHAVTGWQCAGCGTLRCLHQLLHGHPVAAFHLNPLTCAAMPLALYLLANEARIGLGRSPWRPQLRLGKWAWLAPALIVVFLLARNIF